MKNQLVIRILNVSTLNADTVIDWLLFDSYGQSLAQGRNALQEIAQRVNQKSSEYTLNVIAPANAFLLGATTIPSQQSRQVKQALPFMVEELIAEDIDSIHICIPRELTAHNNQVDFAVISHRLLIDLLDQLYGQQLSPDKLFIDALCLPLHENAVTVLLEGEQCTVRSGRYSAMSMATDDYQQVLPVILENVQQLNDNPLLATIHVIGSATDDDKDLSNLNNYITEAFPNNECKASNYQESIFELVAINAITDQDNNLNILQGGYAVKSDQVDFFRHWAVACSIAAIGLLCYLATTLGGGWYFNHQAVSLDDKAITLYKQFFPEQHRVVSPRKQLENHLRLNTPGVESHFLYLLVKTGDALVINKEQSSLVVEQLRFDRDNSELQFQVQSDSISQLELLKQQLSEADLAVEINSASEEGDYVKGQLVVRSM